MKKPRTEKRGQKNKENQIHSLFFCPRFSVRGFFIFLSYIFLSAKRRLHSSSIAAVCVAPARLTPRARTSSSLSSVRTPPAALTCTCGGECLRISIKSSFVAPPAAYPVEVFTQSASRAPQI